MNNLIRTMVLTVLAATVGCSFHASKQDPDKAAAWAVAFARALLVERDMDQMDVASKAAGGTVKYTEYAEQKQFIADRVFTDAEFWKWLMAQRLDR